MPRPNASNPAGASCGSGCGFFLPVVPISGYGPGFGVMLELTLTANTLIQVAEHTGTCSP